LRQNAERPRVLHRPPAEHASANFRDARFDRGEEGSLADAGLPGDHDDASDTRPRAGQRVLELGELIGSADELSTTPAPYAGRHGVLVLELPGGDGHTWSLELPDLTINVRAATPYQHSSAA
jgi:hypothetical protein